MGRLKRLDRLARTLSAPPDAAGFRRRVGALVTAPESLGSTDSPLRRQHQRHRALVYGQVETSAGEDQVLLLTRETNAAEDWPRESIDDLLLMPDLRKRPDIIHAVSYLMRENRIDRIIPLDDYDVETAAMLREHLRLPGLGETGARYFRDKLAAEPDEHDRPYLAVVLVDLLCRIDRLDEAVDVAEEHLKQLDDSSGFSFAELCEEAGRFDALARVAREKGDAVTYVAALIQRGNAE